MTTVQAEKIAPKGTAVAPFRREVRHVPAILPGSDPGSGHTIVIGTHYHQMGLVGDAVVGSAVCSFVPQQIELWAGPVATLSHDTATLDRESRKWLWAYVE
jgi:hypothetical protein